MKVSWRECLRACSLGTNSFSKSVKVKQCTDLHQHHSPKVTEIHTDIKDEKFSKCTTYVSSPDKPDLANIHAIQFRNCFYYKICFYNKTCRNIKRHDKCSSGINAWTLNGTCHSYWYSGDCLYEKDHILFLFLLIVFIPNRQMLTLKKEYSWLTAFSMPFS